MQILVVGGGVIGLDISIELARDGHDVQLLEREIPGQRASWCSAGLLTPSSPWNYGAPLIELAHLSERMFPDRVADLLEHTGIDCEYEIAGMLYPEGVGSDAEKVRSETARRNALGFATEPLARAQLDVLQPGFAPEVTGAGWQPHSARLRPPRLLAAMRRRAVGLGVLITSHCDVTEITGDADGVRGVVTSTGQDMPGDVVVLAAGAWASSLATTIGVEIDVRPVRGQILLLRGEPGLLGPTVNNGDSYLLPRRDGRILVGSTMEDAGFDAVTTPEAISRLRGLARAIFPATENMVGETAWAGLRPGTPDRLPYIGPVQDVPGLLLATGHYRNGILLAPITARLIADVVAGRETEVDLSPFAPRPLDPDRALVPTP
jgi:glycine oxidase